MANLDQDTIRTFLETVGGRCTQPAQVLLLGGSALCLLGNPRPTLDIDYVGDDLRKDDLQQIMEQAARELGLDVEAVPIERFVPLPAGAQTRRLPVGRFGLLEAYIVDPYTIALSKLDRGFDTDLEDVAFLIRGGWIQQDELGRVMETALERAGEFDLSPADMRDHWQTLRNMLESR